MHYLDAATEQERLARATGVASGGPGGGGAKEGGPARAIHMTIKSASAEGDEIVTETMADRLRAVQMESWRRMEYVDENTEDAWVAYKECLFARPDGQGNTTAPSATDKGKGKEGAGNLDTDGLAQPLETDWIEDQLFRAISGIKAHDKKPGEEAVTETAEQVSVSEVQDKGKEAAGLMLEKAAEPKKRPGRPPKSTGPGGAPRRGGRLAKSTSRGAATGSAA